MYQDPMSPVRKRQRMSSPTYDEQVALSQDDLEAFDNFERKLTQLQSPRTQSPAKTTRLSKSPTLTARERRQRAIEEALRDPSEIDKENMQGVAAGNRAFSSSPSKDAPLSSMPRADLESDNPFKESQTSA